MSIEKSKLQAVKTVVTHDNCSDGLASALIIKEVLPGAEFIFAQHNTVSYKDLEVRPNMLFVDIVPPVERYKEFLEAGTLVLDHHKGVREVIEAFGENSVFGDEKTQPGVSGAVLAYEHVWKPLTTHSPKPFVEKFARLAGIRDTWQKKHEEWYEACRQGEILYFYPREMWMGSSMATISHKWDSEYAQVGDILMKKQAESIKRCAKEVFSFTSAKGTKVVCLNHLRMSSDMAEHFDRDQDLVITFSYKVESDSQKPKMILSTRSHTGYNCMALAQRFGGNGHTAAAGFSIEVFPHHANAFQMIQDLVNSHESFYDELKAP